MAGLLLYLISAVVLIIINSLVINTLLDLKFFNRFFVFDHEKLHSFVQQSVRENGTDAKRLVQGFIDQLKADQQYSRFLNLRQDWILNNAGGAMGAIWIVHASLTEYIIIFATATGTEGHTGRLTADDYFMILQGTQMAFAAGSYEAEEYPAGALHHLPRGCAKQIKMPGSCFAVGYARGWIPGLFPLGSADAIFSTVDYVTLWETWKITTREVVGNLWRGKI